MNIVSNMYKDIVYEIITFKTIILNISTHMGYGFIGEVHSENKHWLSIRIYKINLWGTHIYLTFSLPPLHTSHTHTHTHTHTIIYTIFIVPIASWPILIYYLIQFKTYKMQINNHWSSNPLGVPYQTMECVFVGAPTNRLDVAYHLIQPEQLHMYLFCIWQLHVIFYCKKSSVTLKRNHCFINFLMKSIIQN